MSTRLALVMHQPLGSAFRDCAQHILGRVPDLHVFDIQPDAPPQEQIDQMLDWVHSCPTSQPILLLCDLYGATPFNIAAQVLRQSLEEGYIMHLLTGTNACMVLKALTEQQEDPESLSERVRQGALRGIVNADFPPDC